MDNDLIIFSATLFVGIIVFLYNSIKERQDRNERYSERAAIEKLTPLLTELHKLHNISLLYTFYPHFLKKEKYFYDSDTFRSTVSDALVFLENKQFQESFLAIIIAIDQLNLLLKMESDHMSVKSLNEALRKFHEAIIPLNRELSSLLYDKIGELPYKLDFKVSFSSEDTITAIRDSMSLFEQSFQLEDSIELEKLPEEVDQKLRLIRKKFQKK